jgi:transcriptional regulator with XRE-family HTH domain
MRNGEQACRPPAHGLPGPSGTNRRPWPSTHPGEGWRSYRSAMRHRKSPERRRYGPMPQVVLCFGHTLAAENTPDENRTTPAIWYAAGLSAWFSATLQRTKSSSIIQNRPFQRPQVVYKQYARTNFSFICAGGSPRKDGRIGMNKSAAKKMKQRSAGKPDIELGKRIRLRRVEQRISQAELGDQLGVSFQQVQKYEKGVNRVGAARLQQIATALDVPVTFFYDGDGKAREVESLLFLDSSFSLRLLRAYSKIKDQTVQRQLVSLMESIAANEG